MRFHSRSGAALLTAHLIIATTVGVRTWGSAWKNYRATAGKACFTPATEIGCLRLGTSQWQIGRPTSRKNVIAEPTVGIVGFCVVVCRCAMMTDGFLDGMGQIQISKTESKPKGNCDAFPDYYCGRKTKSGGESPGICMTLRAKTSSPWRRC